MFCVIQREVFPADVDALSPKSLLTKGSTLEKLAPFIDGEGLIRVGGRLQESRMSYNAKHLIILGKHGLTELFLNHAHVLRIHQGVEAVLAYIRQRVWKIGGRRLLRSVTDRYVVCRRFRAEVANKVTAPLPHDQVVHQWPFSTSGSCRGGH